MTTFTATYSPDDNKLRLYASTRLDAETYARVKAAGFKWAPKQELFVAPAWTPEREDLALELAGAIDDEDTSLVDRAEQRAERFDGYSDKRAADYRRASDAAAEYARPFADGQPILVGHHSEKRARKDQERCHNAMRRAVKAWETSRYWTDRAAGAIAHAKYKERPDVRARRIKTIEADLRKVQRAGKDADMRAQAWASPSLTLEKARVLTSSYTMNPTVAKRDGEFGWWTGYDVLRPEGERSAGCPAMTLEQVRDLVRAQHANDTARRARWIAHYENRLAYERAMLGESGYVEPPKRASKAMLPLLNYAGEVRVCNPYYGRQGQVDVFTAHPMTKAEFAAIHKDYKGTRVSEDGTHRVRVAMLHYPTRLVAVFLTDAKAHPRPGSEESDAAAEVAARVERAQAKIERTTRARKAALAKNAEVLAAHRGERVAKAQPPAEIDTMRDTLAAGPAPVVAVPQLFPTPPELAARMVALAGIEPGMRVLEPSAGTGALLRAIVDAERAPSRAGPAPDVTAIEINQGLCESLPAHLASSVICADFLDASPGMDGDKFDRIIMNPPFAKAQDVAHILHAMKFLRPGGRLVAICANGPRQHAAIRPVVEAHGGTWEELPAGTFASAGTNVRTALVVVDAPAGQNVRVNRGERNECRAA